MALSFFVSYLYFVKMLVKTYLCKPHPLGLSMSMAVLLEMDLCIGECSGNLTSWTLELEGKLDCLHKY